MISITEDTIDRFFLTLQAYEQATIARLDKKSRLLSLMEVLLQDKGALPFLYQQMPRLEHAGIFKDTVWNDPSKLVPGLVGGTLLASYPTAIMELLSELRLLAIAEGQLDHLYLSQKDALNFLQEVIVKNFDYVTEDFSALAWQKYPEKDLVKIRWLFDFLLEKIPLSSLKSSFAEEIETQAAIRPVLDYKIKNILSFLDQKVTFDEHHPVDQRILPFHKALFRATPTISAVPDQEGYQKVLQKMDAVSLNKECELVGRQMKTTSIVSLHQVTLLKYVAIHFTNFIPLALGLNDHGRVEYERHREMVHRLINDFLTPAKPFAVYGLARVLEKNLFSRKIALNALRRLMQIKIHHQVAKKLEKGNLSNFKAQPIQLLVSGVLCVLGQPLGVRQGNNPTCQSARGISMWSRNSPGKLLNLIIDAATANNLIFRYKSTLIESASTGKGLVDQLDYKLDPVSIVLVPHLDKVYNEMMFRAGSQHPESDPHAMVNPAFYGHWIQTGFFSVFHNQRRTVENFDAFIRTFYAAFHPEYNGGHHLAYPVPLGIFITNAAGTLLGFHAISLLRFEQRPDGHWRVYFFNPNSEGHQNWGQEIYPTVAGNGEKHGESSLPVVQFAARLYAYHYNKLQVGDAGSQVPTEIVNRVKQLAQGSWGKSYRWA